MQYISYSSKKERYNIFDLMIFSLDIFEIISTVVVFHSWFQLDLDSLAFVACLKMTEGQNPWSFRTYNCKKRNDGSYFVAVKLLWSEFCRWDQNYPRILLRILFDIHTSITKQTPNPNADFFQKNEFADFKKKLENVFFDKNKN